MQEFSLKIREDFRRDGLFLNFLVDGHLMRLLAESFPYSRINVGYPGICSEEYNLCEKIVTALQDLPVETSVVGHARRSHLEKMAKIIQDSNNSAANFWIPISDYFVERTLAMPTEKVIDYSKEMIKYWKNDLSNSPIDIALVDCTNELENLGQRLKYSYNELISAGARSIIVCDTLGKTDPRKLDILLKDLPNNSGNLEFHPHNDNGHALENIKVAVAKGFTHVGTSVFGYGERGTMIDPRQLVQDYNIPFVQSKFLEFEKEYKDLILTLSESDEVLIDSQIVTGTQYRLLDRKYDALLGFGVTSDKYVLAKMIGLDPKELSSNILQEMKNRLYKQRRRILRGQDLIDLLKEVSCQ